MPQILDTKNRDGIIAGNWAIIKKSEEVRFSDQYPSNIKVWSDHDYFGDHLRLEITNAVQDAGELVVTAKSDGDYDKTGLPDPLYLDFHFTVEGDKVTRLHTVLSSNSRVIPLPQPVAAFYHASDVYDDALLAGSFEGSAVPLDFHFNLENEKIKALNIVLAGE